ncbi:hypothetical protein HZ326_23274 [Fusarium oxysporum f. sp. albedinis]|nr:hypothetical protein HZ326_23274 [Fusarium oxysporum f. sp. albedinis]
MGSTLQFLDNITSSYIIFQAKFYFRVGNCPNSCVLAVYLSRRISNDDQANGSRNDFSETRRTITQSRPSYLSIQP